MGWGGVGGAKEKRKHLFGLRLQRRRRGPRALQWTPPAPPSFFLLLLGKSLALNCQAPIAPLLALHFMSTLAATLTSCFSFFITFVSGRRAVRPRPSEGRREGEKSRPRIRGRDPTRCHPDRGKGEGGWGMR